MTISDLDFAPPPSPTRTLIALERLRTSPCTWLVTGVAGFIGSNLLERLLLLDQEVIGVDNFATGYQRNLDAVRKSVGDDRWGRFTFIEGDITDRIVCQELCARVDYVLHQAALGSVPRSIVDPAASHEANVNGFLNLLLACVGSRVKRFVFASSSAVYGDSPSLPKKEGDEGNPLSPYALTKQINESYALLASRLYNFPVIGLRYFNVFGPRQDPNGPYAAVIPKWIGSLAAGEPCKIYGDGSTSRDFCFIENVVQANLLAAIAADTRALNRCYNIAVGKRLSLRQLYQLIRVQLEEAGLSCPSAPQYGPFRPGDIMHSHADIRDAVDLLGYQPGFTAQEGIARTVEWYLDELGVRPVAKEEAPVAEVHPTPPAEPEYRAVEAAR